MNLLKIFFLGNTAPMTKYVLLVSYTCSLRHFDYQSIITDEYSVLITHTLTHVLETWLETFDWPFYLWLTSETR